MPFGIQPIHIIVVVIAALLIFGPSKLPEIGRSIGKGLNEFRHSAKEMTESFSEEINKPVEAKSNTIMPPPEGSQPVAPAKTAEQGATCAQCGLVNAPQARFCNNCGAKLGA